MPYRKNVLHFLPNIFSSLFRLTFPIGNSFGFFPVDSMKGVIPGIGVHIEHGFRREISLAFEIIPANLFHKIIDAVLMLMFIFEKRFGHLSIRTDWRLRIN